LQRNMPRGLLHANMMERGCRKFNLLANKRMPTGDPNIPWDVKEAKRIHWQMAGAAELKTGSPDKVADMTSVNANGGAIDDDLDADDEEPVDFTRGPYNNDVDLLGEENNEDDFDVTSQHISQGRCSRNQRRKAAVLALPPTTSLLLLLSWSQRRSQTMHSIASRATRQATTRLRVLTRMITT